MFLAWESRLAFDLKLFVWELNQLNQHSVWPFCAHDMFGIGCGHGVGHELNAFALQISDNARNIFEDECEPANPGLKIKRARGRRVFNFHQLDEGFTCF